VGLDKKRKGIFVKMLNKQDPIQKGQRATRGTMLDEKLGKRNSSPLRKS